MTKYITNVVLVVTKTMPVTGGGKTILLTQFSIGNSIRPTYLPTNVLHKPSLV
jgi:hypothetical protein